MAEERIELSAKERERLKVLHEIQQGHLRQRQRAPSGARRPPLTPRPKDRQEPKA
jgi:hypothetical protein